MSCCEPRDLEVGPILPLWRVIVTAALAGQCMLMSLTVNVSAMRDNERAFLHVFLVGLVVASFELVGGPLVRSVRRALADRRPRFELLFATAIAGALGVSVVSVARGEGDVYFDVVIVLLALHAVGHRVSGVERRKSLAAVRALRTEDAECTLRSCCGATRLVRVTEVVPGDTIVVHPGERVPLDGVVERGEAFVREAPLTGEPFEVPKRTGEPILAGAVVVDASLVLRVTEAHGARMIDRIAQAVEDAWARPARVERVADRLTRVLLPAVVVVSAAVFAGWTLLRGPDVGAVHAMAVLLVACPCAMGFAIPLSIHGALGALGRIGFHLRGGDALERLADVDVVALDKTGTLTLPDTERVDSAIRPRGPYDEATLRELLATVERASHHPVARALVDLAQPTGRFVVDALRTLPAAGVEAEVTDTRAGAHLRIAIGTRALVAPRDAEALRALENSLCVEREGRGVIATVDGTLAALFVVREQAREGALALPGALERLGLRVLVLTGDGDAARPAVFGARETAHGLTPDAKAKRIGRLAAEGHAVLFVGDGVNDGAAMAASHVTLAPDDGTRFAQDVTHGVFRGASLERLGEALEIARRTMASVRASLHYALVYNVAGVAVAATGLLHPVFAALLMVTSSLFVTARASAFVTSLAPSAPGSTALAESVMRSA